MSRHGLGTNPLPRLHLSRSEFEALPVGMPIALDTGCKTSIGTRWKEICWGGIRIREFRGVGADGYLVESYEPIIRVRAISRLVPRPQVTA